ncbi:kinesin-like protein [Stylonychia lemnae]|uniref:Kinesin-like protein n=1 Tax=Stylonychia lemnae TaxID=5949 RepID=A0A078B1H4_STYLE|nr:kinesin-like protein [Stylonychia lemnae]|eukprot:CDW87088.1 kinesin-like protein [Stylonychia lemnae]
MSSTQNKAELNQLSNSSTRKIQNQLKSPKNQSYKQFSQNNFEYSIFTPVEESPYVISSEECPVKGKLINSFLVSQNEIPKFTNENITHGNKAQLFIFDKVINESNCNQSLYSKLIRNEVHNLAKSQVNQNINPNNFCCILFGPTDQNEKSSKLSQLLTTKSDGTNSNIALKSVYDILTIKETKLKEINSRLGVQIMQIYCNDIFDLLIADSQKQSNKAILKEVSNENSSNAKSFSIQSTIKSIRNVQDFCQILRVAQQNRSAVAQQLKIESSTMKNTAHLIIRIINGTQLYDFVELCGSELAASTVQTHLVGKQVEILRKFATSSFNSMSMLLTKQNPQMKDHHTALSQILQSNLCESRTKVILCCQVSPAQYLFRHSITAIKFSSKIREVIVKKHLKESKNMINISNELHDMSQRILDDPHISSNKDLICQFNSLREKYEEIMSQSKSFGAILKDQEKYQQLERIRNEFNTLKDEFNVFEMNHLSESNIHENENQQKQQSEQQFIYDSFNQVQRIDSSNVSKREDSTMKKPRLQSKPLKDKRLQKGNRKSRQSNNVSLNKNSDSFTNNSITYQITPTPDFKNHRFIEDSVSLKDTGDMHFNQHSNILIDSNSPSLDRDYQCMKNEFNAEREIEETSSINIDNEDFSLNITVSENTNNVANHTQNHSYNITHSSSQNRLTQESQKLLEKYREAKRSKQERENSKNHSYQNNQQSTQFKREKKETPTSSNFEIKSDMTYKMSGTQATYIDYMATDDMQIGKLQLEIQLLQNQLKDKTIETDTLQRALHNAKQEQSTPYLNKKYKNLDLAQELDDNSNFVRQIEELEGKLDLKNEQIATMLRNKQQDQKELNEIRFKLDREAQHSQKVTAENESLRARIEQMQKRFIDQERVIETQKIEIKNLTQQNDKEGKLKLMIDHKTDNSRQERANQTQIDEMKSEMYDMKLELETLKRQKNILQNQQDDTKTESQQLFNLVKAKDQKIEELEETITQMKASEYDKVNMIQKQSEFDIKILNIQHQLQQAHKDKKKAEDDLFVARDKLREILGEKISLENQLNHIERVEGSRINELESRYEQLSREYQHTLEVNKQLSGKDIEQRREIQGLQNGRDSFKEQFLELKQFNKDLKNRFIEIERQVSELIAEDKKKDNYEKENHKNENKKKEGILQDIQGLIKDYKKNARDKKTRYAFNPIIDSTNDTNSFL